MKNDKSKTQQISLGVGLLALAAWGQPVLAQDEPTHPTGSHQAVVDRQEIIDLNIPSSRLDHALLAFAKQTGAGVFIDGLQLSHQQSPRLQGRYTYDQALALLLDGSGFGFRLQDRDGALQVILIDLKQQANAPMEIGTVAVEGIATEERDNAWVYQQPRSVSVITREQMDKRPPRHAADMLVDTPGVTSAVNRHNPALSVNIRGMQDFGRVNMMIDGMRQNHVESGHQQRNGEMYVDSELLSEVVIEKGPNAGVHGANAIAGSANFKTLDYDDIILPNQTHGVRLRAGSGIGGDSNGVKFQGSAAVAGRFDDRLELLFASSQKNLGEYAIGDRGRTWYTSSSSLGQEQIEEVKFSDQKQESLLAKSRLKINDDHSLQFIYTSTDISYYNTSEWSQENVNGYRAYGKAKAKNDSYALEWKFNPDNPLIDLKTKIYYVSTENERIVNPNESASTEYAWNNNECIKDTISSSWQSACLNGMTRNTTTRTDTLGLQVENTSKLYFPIENSTLSANYGLEWFQDEGKSKNSANRNGLTTENLDKLTGNSLNPNGLRDIASAFSSLTFEQGSLTLKAGLRYDWYHLRGKASVPSAKNHRISRFESYLKYWCERNQNNAINFAGCQAGLNGGEAGAIAWWESAQSSTTYHNTTRWKEEWIDEAIISEHDVDRSQGKFSPFASAAWRPLEWLEFFTNWGKGFRPPAMTETLWQGSHPVGSSATMYPNPLLDPERSTSWELGFNILKRDLLKTGDVAALKLAYFDTRVDNFIFTGLTNAVPGSLTHADSHVFFVNNLEKTNFRGLELEANYDSGNIYGGINATKYIGGENDFCKKLRPLGSQISRFDQPNEDGSMTSQHIQALAEGYSSYQEKLDSQTICGIGGVMNATRAIPMDRHGAYLGFRTFNKSLDIGIRYNRSKGDAPSNWTNGNDLWDSYTTWDAYAKYQVLQRLSINLAIENIRNENYLGGYSDMFARTYAPGRTVQAGLELKF